MFFSTEININKTPKILNYWLENGLIDKVDVKIPKNQKTIYTKMDHSRTTLLKSSKSTKK